VGRFLVGFIAQGAIQSPTDGNVKERKVVIYLHLNGKLKATQMVKPALQFVGRYFQGLSSNSSIKKLAMTGESGETIATLSVYL
jgi:hypothetical protein